jgi:HSP20 family molecular chaperone IbpA
MTAARGQYCCYAKENKMNDYSHIDNFIRHAVGFDRVMGAYKRDTTSKTGFPFWNLVKDSETAFTLSLALAGYKVSDITVELDGSTLRIFSEGCKDKVEKEYLTRGYSIKSFDRTFTLHDSMVVKNVTMNDGILVLNLERIVPEKLKPQKIQINGLTASERVQLNG